MGTIAILTSVVSTFATVMCLLAWAEDRRRNG